MTLHLSDYKSNACLSHKVFVSQLVLEYTYLSALNQLMHSLTVGGVSSILECILMTTQWLFVPLVKGSTQLELHCRIWLIRAPKILALFFVCIKYSLLVIYNRSQSRGQGAKPGLFSKSFYDKSHDLIRGTRKFGLSPTN